MSTNSLKIKYKLKKSFLFENWTCKKELNNNNN